MRTPISAVLVFAMACSSQAGDRSAGAPGASDGGGGGGVGFGGAQDIGELRGILDRGELPGPDVLDANGFFAEHYNPPIPASCGALLCVTPGMSVGRDWMTGAHQATLQLAIHSTVDPTSYTRLPMRLVLVVDHSGSMASDGRLTKVKGGLHTLIDHLRDEDRLAIVEFDDRVDVDAVFGERLDRAAMHAIVDRMNPRGSTNIYGGLERGFQLLGDAPGQDRQHRVILLSDGLATAGDTSREHIQQMARSYVQRGVGLTTIGVGDEFDVGLMRGLAEQGAGNFYFLEDPTAASEVFTEELDYFMQPIALDLRLEARAGAGFRFGEIAGSRLWTAEPQRGAMEVPAVFVASRTSQTGGQGRRGGGSMLFIHLTPTEGLPGKVADLTLSYRVPGSLDRISQTVALDYGRDPRTTPETPYLSVPEMAERFAMYNTFLGLRAATRASDLGCATAILRATRASATAWNQSHEDPDIAADVALIDQYLANLAERGGAVERPIASCPTAAGPGDLNYPTYPVDDAIDHQHGLYCAAGGPAGGLPIALAALLAVRRRRRA